MPQLTLASRITLIGLFSLALAVGIGRFAFTPLLPMMRADGLIDISGGGWLASAHFLGYLIGALSAAVVPCPPRLLLRIALVAIGIGTLGMGLTANFFVWLALRFFAGVFSAWVLVLVSSHYVRRLAAMDRAGLQGCVFAGVGAGIAIAGLACLAFMSVNTSSAESWRILGIAGLAIIGAICLSISSEVPASRRCRSAKPRAPAGTSPRRTATASTSSRRSANVSLQARTASWSAPRTSARARARRR